METNKALVELSDNLRSLSKQAWKTGEYLLTPKDVRYYLGFAHSYSRAYTKDLLYKFHCPHPRRDSSKTYVPISKGSVDQFVRQRKTRKCRPTQRHLESLRLIEEVGLSYREAASCLGDYLSTVHRRVQKMRRIREERGGLDSFLSRQVLYDMK